MSGTRLELSPSRTFALVLVVLHAAAAASVIAVTGTASGHALGAALLALGLAAAWGRALLRSPASVRAIELSGPEFLVELKDGRRMPAELGGHRHVGRLMVTLPVRRPVRRTILVTRDMLGSEEFRQLRIWTLWGRLPGVAGKQLST
ncbi:MAG: hypothetical protein ACREUS_03830 [Burkholderiales bacterium]